MGTQITWRYDATQKLIVASGYLPAGPGRVRPMTVRVKIGEITQRVEDLLNRAAAELPPEVGFAFLKKAADKIKEKAFRVAKAVGVAKAVTKITKAAKKALVTAKKVVQSPAFAAVITATSILVPGAQGLAPAYAAVRAALALADRVKKGDPAALAKIQEYAASSSPEAKMILNTIAKAKNAIPPVPVSANPWIQGLPGDIRALLPA